MPDIVDAWQCIGCGKIEAPKPCIGICQDRKVQFVYVDDYAAAVQQAQAAIESADALKAGLIDSWCTRWAQHAR